MIFYLFVAETIFLEPAHAWLKIGVRGFEFGCRPLKNIKRMTYGMTDNCKA
jgi:hypothetical protein